MRIIFCNISHMTGYCGTENGDIPLNGGKFPEKNKTGGEIYNFLDYDKKCYGYFMHYGDILHIERIENITRNDDIAEDVLVVWVAKPDKKNSRSVIVGWYRHADVYRKWQNDGEWDYNISAKAENCHLLPVDEQTFIMPRAGAKGKGKGMGQSAIWYADSEYARKEFVPQVVDYINNYEKNIGKFANKVWTEKELNKKYIGNKSDNELLQLARDGNISPEKSLEYINASLEYGKTSDKLHIKADILTELFQFTKAIPYYKKAYLLDNSNFESLKELFDMYCLTEQTEKALETGQLLEKSEYFNEFTPDNKIVFYNAMIIGCENLNLVTLADSYINKLNAINK